MNKQKTPIYKCNSCGKWSRKEFKFLDNDNIPTCDCGQPMVLLYGDLEPLIDKPVFPRTNSRSPNPKNRKGGTGRPRKEKEHTQREKLNAEIAARRAKGERRGGKISNTINE